MDEGTPGQALVLWREPSTKKKRSELDGLLPFAWDKKGAPAGPAMLNQYGPPVTWGADEVRAAVAPQTAPARTKPPSHLPA